MRAPRATPALFAVALSLGALSLGALAACDSGDSTDSDDEPLGSTSDQPSASSPSQMATSNPTMPASSTTDQEPEPESPMGNGGEPSTDPPEEPSVEPEPDVSGEGGSSGIGGTGSGGDRNPPAAGSGNTQEPEPEPMDAGSGEGGAGSPDASSGGTGGADTAGGSCEGRDLILCEDFEDTEIGDIPEDWYRLGEEVGVADDQAWRGSRSLKLEAIPFWERRIGHDASELGSAHWGRIHYRVELPVPDAFVHSTMVALTGDGPEYGASEYRFIDTVKQAVDTPDVGSRHNFLFNVQPEESDEFGRETSYDFEFDGEWHCAEYHVDASNQSYAFYLDGNEELSFEDGAGNYDDSDLPDSFEEIRVGWNNYQQAPPGFVAWMDDIAFDDERIGCD